MDSASKSIRAAVLFVLSGLSGTVASPKAVNSPRNAETLPLSFMAAGNAICRIASGNAGDASAPCDRDPAPMSAPAVNPCSKPGQLGCDAPTDPVRKDLAAMGKTGQKISRARDKVLEILQGENACSNWIRQLDANPAATFRTISFEVDRHGVEGVRAIRDTASQYTYRGPYVASVGQAIGAHATIKLNGVGAFFQPLSPVLLVSVEGGPVRSGGARLIGIGPYPGDSLAAQTLALLHEFGHVIDLLPSDFENEEGKSMQNTAEVLRNCRAEIDAKDHRTSLQVAK